MLSNQFDSASAPGSAQSTSLSKPVPKDLLGGLYVTAREIAHLVAREPALYAETAPCAYLSGGWVRDRVLGKAAADIDVEVFGVPKERLLGLLQGSFPNRVIAPSDNPTAPIKVLVEGGLYLDITTPIRSTAAHGSENDSYAPAPEMSVAEAAKRRDFSCNAIYFDPLREQYIDPEGGLEDLSRGVLRLVRNLPEFIIDSGAPLRACRFLAEYSLTLDPDSEVLLRESVGRNSLSKLAAPFLTKEVRKLLCDCREPAKALRFAESLGVLKSLFPAVAGLRDVPQDSRHHPEGDALEHTLLVVDAAALLSREQPSVERFKILLAALLHDVGKLTHTKRVESDGTLKIIAHGHEHGSAQLAAQALKKLSINSTARTEILRMVRHHMRPLQLDSSKLQPGDRFDNEVRKLVRDVSPAQFSSFVIVCRADRLGRGGHLNIPTSVAIFERVEESVCRLDFLADPRSRLLKGSDLERMGFSEADVDFGPILRSVEARRDSGVLKTAGDAERFVLRAYAARRLESGLSPGMTHKQRELLGRAVSAAIAKGELRSVGEISAFINNQRQLL